MVCYYHHQEERVGVIQGIKLIIGLIRGMCILMRHSAMGPLQAEMLSCCVLTRLKTRPPGWIGLSLETHYPIPMMQYISKTTGPMTSEGNWLCLATAVTIYSTLKVVPSKSNLFFRFKLSICGVLNKSHHKTSKTQFIKQFVCKDHINLQKL